MSLPDMHRISSRWWNRRNVDSS